MQATSQVKATQKKTTEVDTSLIVSGQCNREKTSRAFAMTDHEPQEDPITKKNTVQRSFLMLRCHHTCMKVMTLRLLMWSLAWRGT